MFNGDTPNLTQVYCKVSFRRTPMAVLGQLKGGSEHILHIIHVHIVIEYLQYAIPLWSDNSGSMKTRKTI